MIENFETKIQLVPQKKRDWAHFVYKFLFLSSSEAFQKALFLCMRFSVFSAFLLGVSGVLSAQNSPEEIKKEVPHTPKVKNVILMIGDGTGLAQWSAAQSRVKDPLHVYTLSEYLCLSKTSSTSHFIT